MLCKVYMVYKSKSNKENSEAMAKGVMAILYYYSSTEEGPQYLHFPEGEHHGAYFKWINTTGDTI